MKRFTTIFLAVFSVVLAAAMIVRSKQEWEGNADGLMRTLTPDVLIRHCGQPAADTASGSTIGNRQMFYPTSRDGSMGLIFTFSRAPNDPRWTYLSFHLGAPKGKGLSEMENVEESNDWAIIELPCLK
jgi:hypothetical protein